MTERAKPTVKVSHVGTDNAAPKAAPDALAQRAKRYPTGLRTLPVAAPKPADGRVRAEGCGPGFKRPRALRLDERDGDGVF